MKRQLSTSRTLELRSCVKVEVAVLGSPSLIVLTVSVDVIQHLKKCWTSLKSTTGHGGICRHSEKNTSVTKNVLFVKYTVYSLLYSTDRVI